MLMCRILGTVLFAALLVGLTRGHLAAEPNERMIIFGFDGVDPGIIEQMFAAGPKGRASLPTLGA